MKATLRQRFDKNLQRVNNLANIYETKLAPAAQGRKPIGSTDILRAAVVFLHATVEEYLRGILEWRLPEQEEATINNVPLVGSETARAEKFFLGRLVAHRDKTVADLIQKSVTASLTRSNYNTITEITSVLDSVGLNVVPCQPFFGQMARLMERRHQIVHRADSNPNQGQGQHEASSIGRHHIHQWVQAVEGFFNAVQAQLPD